MHVKNGTAEGIYYTINGDIHNRTVIFEYYMTRNRQKEQYYHFQVLFFEAKPGIVQYIYLNVTDGGSSATVGVQGKSLY